MDNIEKKLDALIDALGFDVKEVDVPRAEGYDPYPVYRAINYELTKKVALNAFDEINGCILVPKEEYEELTLTR
jgi:hypothetical protein